MNAADKYQLYDYLKKAKGKGINKVYLHWTAGGYNTVFPYYHACIKGDGEVYFMTDNLVEKNPIQRGAIQTPSELPCAVLLRLLPTSVHRTILVNTLRPVLK